MQIQCQHRIYMLFSYQDICSKNVSLFHVDNIQLDTACKQVDWIYSDNTLLDRAHRKNLTKFCMFHPDRNLKECEQWKSFVAVLDFCLFGVNHNPLTQTLCTIQCIINKSSFSIRALVTKVTVALILIEPKFTWKAESTSLPILIMSSWTGKT